MSEILNLRNIDYNLHFQIDFKEGPVNGELSSPKNMEYISYEAGSASSNTEFTTNIKSWIPKHFPCTLCRIYIHHAGSTD